MEIRLLAYSHHGHIHYLFRPHWCERLRFMLRTALTTTPLSPTFSAKYSFACFVSLSILVHFTTLRSTFPHFLKTYLYILIKNSISVCLAVAEKKCQKGSIYLQYAIGRAHRAKNKNLSSSLHSQSVCFNIGMLCLVESIARILSHSKIAGTPVRTLLSYYF